MSDVLLVVRILLAAVFAMAGASKLMDRAGTQRAIVDFGVPKRLAEPLALALPLTELAIAAGLLPALTAWAASVAALLLLLAFLTAIGFSLAERRRPDCRCFGQFRPTPVGASTVVLNCILIALAAFVARQGIADPGADLFARINRLAPTEVVVIAAFLAIAALCTLIVRMLRQQTELAVRLDQLEERFAHKGLALPGKPDSDGGLPIGTKAPAFALESLSGGAMTLDHLLTAGIPVLLVFTAPNCGPCEALLPKLARWQREHGDAVTIAVLSEGTPQENRSKIGAHGLHSVLLQWKGEIADAYQCFGVPGAVLVRPDGTIGSLVAGGNDAIERLLGSITGRLDQPSRIGSPVLST
jgi:methylamine dehydrogenase accessory protein MauD